MILCCGLTAWLSAQTLWLDEIQTNLMESGRGESRAGFSAAGHPLKVAGQTFKRGVGTHPVSRIMFLLQGKAVRFTALVGVDDAADSLAEAEFFVLADQRIIWKSGPMKKGDTARKADVSLDGVHKLALLVSGNGNPERMAYADWLDARIEYNEVKPVVHRLRTQRPYLMTPPEAKEPAINHPRIFGSRPGNPFLFAVPATGEKPLQYEASELPEGLKLDPVSGIISGTTPPPGRYSVELKVLNKHGETAATLTIVSGDKIALTPPMGWISPPESGPGFTSAQAGLAARSMAEKLRGHGWSYLIIRDGWQMPGRDAGGRLLPSEAFPDMEAWSENLHGLGLKSGILAKAAEGNCKAKPGSAGFEKKDAETWRKWGIDLLLYELCDAATALSRDEVLKMKQPFYIMRDALQNQPRDIVYGINTLGFGRAWEWAESVGAQMWRTEGEMSDSWQYILRNGFSRHPSAAYIKPGAWNDHGVLPLGKTGYGSKQRNTRLTPNEQYACMTLWSILASPLIMAGDLTALDEFTLNLLTNDEVIGVNQDPRGAPARRISADGEDEIWVRDMADGSKVLALFYRKPPGEGPAAEFIWEDEIRPKLIRVNWARLGITGTWLVRDLWIQKDAGQAHEFVIAEVPWHGAAMLKLTPLNQ